jgi:multidrug resistance efflux pump
MILKYGLPVVAAALLGFALFSIAHSQPVRQVVPPPAAPAASPFHDQVAGVGIAEAASENIAVSLPVPGLVTAVYVKAGDHVRKGQALFSLDDRDLRAELTLRQSASSVAATKLQKLIDEPRPEEIPPAEARVHEAEQNEQDAAVQVRLIESVTDKRAIREEDLLRRRVAYAAAKARLEQAKADLVLLKAGAWAPDIAQAKAELSEAQRQVERVQADINRLLVTAPLDGEVLQCKVHPGEFAQAGPLAQPLMLMGDTTHLNVRVDFDEEDATRLQTSASAVATPRGASATRLPIHFIRFEPYVVPKVNLTNGTAERVDTRVVQAIYALDHNAPIRPGEQMDVFVQASR